MRHVYSTVELLNQKHIVRFANIKVYLQPSAIAFITSEAHFMHQRRGIRIQIF